MKKKNDSKKYYIFSLDMMFLNVFSFVLLFLVVWLTLLIDKEFLMDSIEYTFATERLFLKFILVIGYLMLHELLNSLGYYLYGAKYKKIVYGIELEKGIFYCLCKENIKKRNIMNSLMFPLFYIGVVTYFVSFMIDSSYLLILSIFNISGCVGDIFTFLFMLRLDKNIEFSEFDDTTSFGIYTDKDISKNKYIGLKYIDTRDELVRKDYTKIKISKWSYVILIVMFIISLITIFL